jgi:hypothetical protein
MTTNTFEGPAILIGYAYTLQVEADTPLFPETGAYRAQVREKVSAAQIAADLATENGGIVRISDYEINIVIPPSATAGMKPGSVLFDVVRTDTDPHLHLNFFVEIPVMLPVTRGAQ